MARIVPFAGADDDAHVIVFPWVGHVRQIFVWTVEGNVVVVIAVENELMSNEPLKLMRWLTVSG